MLALSVFARASVLDEANTNGPDRSLPGASGEFDPAKPYPAILAFGGGPQTMDILERSLRRRLAGVADSAEYARMTLAGRCENERFLSRRKSAAIS